MVFGLGGDVVSGAGLLVTVTHDAAHQLGGLMAGAAARHMHPRLLVGVFMLGFGAPPLIEVGVVSLAAAGHGDVEQIAGGGLAQHGMRGVGGDPLGACTVTAYP